MFLKNSLRFHLILEQISPNLQILFDFEIRNAGLNPDVLIDKWDSLSTFAAGANSF